MQQRIGEDPQTSVAQRGSGGHHIGDQVGDAQLHGGLHGAVQVNGFGVDAMLGQVIMHQFVERGAHALALDVLKPADRRIIGSRETERRRAEAELHVFLGVRTRVEQQVMSRDADVDGASSDIHRDVERTQIKQFDPVVWIFHDQLARIAPKTIAGLGQHIPCGLG